MVTCALNTEATGDGLVVMGGASGDGGIGNRCDLVVENGRVTGLIDVPAGRYSIRPLEAANVHAVVQVKTEAFPDEMESRARGAIGPRQSIPMCDVRPRQGQQPKSFGPIRVLIAYTPAARERRPNIGAEIQTMMGQFRDAMSLRLTGGNFSVSTELAHSVEVNYRESDSPSMDMDLERLSDPTDPVFRTVHSLRDTHKADLVHLLVRGRREDGCGIAWTPRDITKIDESMGFSVSDRQCATENLSFAHELGHNLGMKHDRGVEKDAKPGPEEFRFGYVLIQHGVRSTLAYNDVCKQQGKSCRRLLAYSSPNLFYSNPNTGARNVPFGRPINAPDAAYNIEVLCRNADTIAKFR